MEKISPKMAGAFGVGFLGFIMAAYSYNKHHKPEYADNLVKNFSEDTDEERDDENNDAVGDCVSAASSVNRPHEVVDVAVSVIDPQLRRILAENGHSLTLPKLISRMRWLGVDVLPKMSSVGN